MYVSLLFYYVLARASWRPAKKHAGRPSLLVFPRLIRVKEPRSPSSFPSPKDRSRPESGCKDKPIFYPNPNFSPTFLRKNQTRKHNRLENNGEQECFFSGWTRSSGRRPSDSGNKAPPTDMRAKEELPAVLENRDTEPMDSKSPESNHAKAPILTPGNPVRPRASSAPAQGAPRARTIYA